MCRIKHLSWAWAETVPGKHFLRGLYRHFRKERSPSRQPHVGYPRQVKHIIAVQEQTEDVGTAENADPTVRRAERSQGLLERSPGRVPKHGVFVRRVGGDGGDFPGQN